MRYSRKILLGDKFLFVDGLTRSGKMLICKTLSHLEKVEYFQTQTIIDQSIWMHFVGGAKREFIVPFLQARLSEFLYHRAIGRELNTRVGDETSIFNAPDLGEYISRSANKVEGIDAVNLYNSKGRKLLFLVHNVLPSAEVIFDAVPTAQMFHFSRHPLDLYVEWEKRGWGSRELTDPMSFVPVVVTEHGECPWYAIPWAESYQKMNSYERRIFAIMHLQKLDDQGQENLSEHDKTRLFRFCFEAFVSNPMEIVQQVCDVLETSPHPSLKHFLSSENCPRILEPKRQDLILSNLRQNIRADRFASLESHVFAYQKRWML